ncbi:hypothetical protein MSG28_007561 [Choristoneura fumiferana]|uniref:Uncharacterized protein n=1 Tax=Choristoneura fumiferana TaxID=7141 RepID=A0ACC0JYC9_CHOFU|nr:hypothetical protein MSG28_007561 [Choristoneura fumiferana]
MSKEEPPDPGGSSSLQPPSPAYYVTHLHSSARNSTETIEAYTRLHHSSDYGSGEDFGQRVAKKYLNEEKMESPRMAKHKSEKAASAKTVPITTESTAASNT